MQVKESSKLPGVRLFIPDVFTDFRGDYVMLYNRREYGLDMEFVEDCISTSRRNVLRGMHEDPICHKLITVLHGTIFYVVLDARLGVWESFILSGENHYVIYKPPQYAAGFLALTDDVCFSYKQSAYYDPNRQKTYSYQAYNIPWPLTGKPLLSERDHEAAEVLKAR